MSPDEKLARREEAKRLAALQAFEEGQDCPHCGGSGRVEGGRALIHSVRGGLGADWDLAEVQRAIDAADEVAWVDGFAGHDLRVTVRAGFIFPRDPNRDERVTYHFAVRRPEPA